MAARRNEADVVLDAARECILDFGLRRTTLTEIAQRAGISRPTLYRRYPDQRSLVRALVTREIVGLLPDRFEDGPVVDSLVAALVATAAKVRTDPLVRRIIQLDPELLVPYVFERLGSSQRTILTTLSTAIAAGHADGSIRPGRPEQQAAMVLLAVQSAVQSAQIVAEQLDGADLDRELAMLLRGYLEEAHA